MSTWTQTETTQRNHRRAVRFFWCFLIGATAASLIGNVAHAVLPYVPPIVVQIGAAAVPPMALLAAVHGIALAVRAGASGRVYCWAVSAVAAIGVGAFAVSFLALRDLMQAIGYGDTTAWIFPAIIDTAVAVGTVMLVALGDKPTRRTRTASTPVSKQNLAMQRAARNEKPQVTPVRSAQSACTDGASRPRKGFASVQLDAAQTVRSAQADVALSRPRGRRPCGHLSQHRVPTPAAAHQTGAADPLLQGLVRQASEEGRGAAGAVPTIEQTGCPLLPRRP
jgi:Protein of unknown function (DUF2637)